MITLHSSPDSLKELERVLYNEWKDIQPISIEDLRVSIPRIT